MADENIIGFKVVAETDSFDVAMKKTRENVKQLGANFKEQTAHLDRWSKSAEGLTAKVDQLNGEMDQYKTQADAIRKKIAELSENEEANAKAIENKKKELQEANTKYQEAKQNLSYYQKQLDEVESASGQLSQKISEQKQKVDELSRSYKDAVLTYGENSSQARDLARQVKLASNELDNLEQQSTEADTALSRLSDATIDTNTHLGNMEAIGKRAGGVLKKLGLGVTALATGFIATAESTRDIRTNMGKLDTAFTTNGHTAEQAKKTYKELYGILADTDQATEASNLIASMAKNEKDLKKWTEISTGVFAKFGDSLPVESLMEASMETAKTGEIVGSLADALNWAGINQDAFQKKLDNCSSEEERQALITDVLTKKYVKAGKQYRETNKDIIKTNEAQSDLSDQMAEIGKLAEPLMGQIKEMGASLIKNIVPFIEKWMPKIQENLPLIASGIAILVAGLGGLAVATTVAKVAFDAWTVAVKTWSVVTKVATAIQTAFNASMLASPIGLVVLGIGALVIAITVLWKKSESFRNFWIGLWETIKSACSKAWESISGFATKSWDKVKGAWEKAGDFFSGIWDTIKKGASKTAEIIGTKFKSAYTNTTNIWSKFDTFMGDKFGSAWKLIKLAFTPWELYFKGIFNGIKLIFGVIGDVLHGDFKGAWERIKNAWSGVKDYFKGKSDDVVSAFNNLPKDMVSIGKNMIEGLWNGIKDMTKWITGKLEDFSGNVLDGIKKFFKIESPSKVMRDQVGKNIVKGMAEGIKKETKTVTTAMNKVGDKALNSAKKITGKIQDQYDSVKDNQSAMEDRLSGTGDLYSIDEETGKVTLNNLKDETAQIKKFGKNLLNLKSKLPKGMMAELSGLDTEEGIKVTDAIKAMSKKELKAYADSYKAREKASEQASSKYYSDEVKTVKNKFADKVSDVMNALPKKLKTIGVNTMNGFGKGMKSSQKSMSKIISSVSSDIINQFKKDLKIHSPSEETAEDGQYLVEGLGEGIENAQDGLFAKLANFTSDIVDFFKDAFADGNVLTGIKNIFIKLGDLLGGEVKELLTKVAKALGFDIGTGLTNGIEEGLESAGDDLDEQLTKKLSLGDKIKAGLDKASKYFADWQKGAGAYISQVKGYFEQASKYVMDLADSIGSYFSIVTDNAIANIEEQVEALQKATQTEITDRENQTNAEIANLDMQKEAGVLSDEEYAIRKQQIQQELADFTAKKNEEEALSEEKLLKKKDELARKQFESNKKSQIAQVLISTATAIMQAFAQLGPIAGAVASALIGATSIAQIATINAQRYTPALAKGGVVDNATLAMIGENGKEAVIPLEKNTGWMVELAEKLSGIMQKDFLGSVQSNSDFGTLNTGNNSTVNNFTQVINAPKTPSRRELYRDSKNLLALKGV